MSKKEEYFKERFKQALDSTYKVISEEFHNLNNKENQKDIEDYKISNLYSLFPTTAASSWSLRLAAEAACRAAAAAAVVGRARLV